MKKLIAIAAATLFVVGIGIAAISADAPVGPQPVSSFGEKPVITFNHDTHKEAAADCAFCHHKAESGSYKCSTAECHDSADKMKDAAHKKEIGKCWGCHNKKSPDVKKAMKCKECHVK